MCLHCCTSFRKSKMVVSPQSGAAARYCAGPSTRRAKHLTRTGFCVIGGEPEIIRKRPPWAASPACPNARSNHTDPFRCFGRGLDIAPGLTLPGHEARGPELAGPGLDQNRPPPSKPHSTGDA